MRKKAVVEKTITLMCDHGACCPTVTFAGNEAVIKDDFGGQVRLTLKQLQLLIKEMPSN